MSTMLPDGKLVPCSLVAIDVVGHSSLVLSLSNKKTEKLFAEIEHRVRTEVQHSRGLLLGWQGDGGIAVFHTSDSSDDDARAQAALNSAEAILKLFPLISSQHKLGNDDALQVRIAVHSGALIWRRATGSIHSADVNFVAHLEHALPNGAIGVSGAAVKALTEDVRKYCISVGKLENHEVFIYARTLPTRQRTATLYEQECTISKMGKLCMEDGLVHFEFRDYHHRKLPPPDIYGQAQKEILMSGITLAGSLKQTDVLRALQAASERGVRLYLLVLDPKNVGSPFATGLDSIGEAISALRDELKSERIRQAITEVKGTDSWPHFTGIMIDGDVDHPLNGATLPYSKTLLLRVQATIPPDMARNQHCAPVFQYKSAQPSPTMLAYMRGFRYYWQNARKLL